jgi:hypothetical protein
LKGRCVATCGQYDRAVLPRVPWLGDEPIPYLELLNPSARHSVCAELLTRTRGRAPGAPADAIAAMLTMSWRPALVACAAVCARADGERFAAPLTALLREGSWVSPQVAVALGHARRWDLAAVVADLDLTALPDKARGGLWAIGVTWQTAPASGGWSEFGLGRGVAEQWLAEVVVPPRAPAP